MNKILILISFFLFSCTTGFDLVSKNKIVIGMSKTELCDVFLWRSSYEEDACLDSGGSGLGRSVIIVTAELEVS